jgi:hypothetical protein
MFACFITKNSPRQRDGSASSLTILLRMEAAEGEIQRIVDSGEEVALKSLAGKIVQEYGDIIRTLVKAWPRVVLRLGGEVDTPRHAAAQKRMDPQASAAMKRIAASPELNKALGKAADRSIVSFDYFV